MSSTAEGRPGSARQLVAGALLVILAADGCGTKQLRRVQAVDATPATVDQAAPFIKAHMRDGSLFVLSPWLFNDTTRVVSGPGTLFGLDRKPVASGPFSLSVDSVALFETNVAHPSPAVASLSIITGLTLGVTVVCIADPKTCFGSCPTFYASDGSRPLLQAEGFSSSISPRLEATDIDALWRVKAPGRELRLEMVNEAYETHVVRWADLLVLPRREGRRAMADLDGVFWSASEPIAASSCSGPEGDCRSALAAFDERERTSLSDSTDLAAHEEIELRFSDPGALPALVIASRQSLLPTYVLYQAFSYLGSTVGDWMSRFERGALPAAQGATNLVSTLGGIDVLVMNPDGGWDSVATVHETGPLAADLRLVALPAPMGELRVRLRMARGAWRIDYAGLVSRGERLQPRRLAPARVLAKGVADEAARARLLDPGQVLVTYPGDRYTLVYELPAEGAGLEYFLETRGYYIEWMRREWIAEEDLGKAATLFFDPRRALRDLAPAFKRAEPGIEAAFWNSRYVGK